MGRMVEVIQPEKELTIEKKEKIRVAAYARVSKDTENMEDSYVSQKKHAEEVINRNPYWILTKIYSDQASGLNTKKRTGFNNMMKAARRHEMDLILVKSISRFGRSVIDTLTNLRELEKCGIRVFFDRENMFSDDTNCRMLLSVMASMAESESISISGNVRLGQKYKAERGEWTVAYSTFLGYERNSDGEVVVNDEQAKTVRYIFSEFLSGTSLQDLCRKLEEGGHKTGMGNEKWTKTGVRRILSNIKYSGDVIQGLTYTSDIMMKKREINDDKAPQYIIYDGITPIIDRQTHHLAKGELMRREALFIGKEVEGPVIYNQKNDFTRLVVCPDCGAFFNRSNARTHFVWKCYKRIHGNCEAEIIREDTLQDVVLQAAQKLYDEHPEIPQKSVPILKQKDSDDTLMQAAGLNSYNSFAKRVQDFIDGERPEEYSPDIPKRLIEQITFTDTEWVITFYGDQVIKVPRTAKEGTGRRLKRLKTQEGEADDQVRAG